MQFFTPRIWSEYQLIDSGNFEKLERFGNIILQRPETNAIWNKSLSDNEWKKQAHIRFNETSNNSGEWIKADSIPDAWQISYDLFSVTCNLKLTAFKHIGIFPEQAVNWEYIHTICKKNQNVRVLNLFGYTGIASVVARAAGAHVTHLDSIKQVVHWTRKNMEDSNQSDIRWIIEDARKFVSKEIKRGNTYNGIIMDPPAFGRGTHGEEWKLERDLHNLLKDVERILDKKNYFFILNTYSQGFTPFIIKDLLHSIFINHAAPKEFGELYIPDTFQKKLPLGVIGRFTNLL
ncbi:MAG: class I SAM-dependent methyltransferase [Bacteroidales bacterium]|nr:class I SAM-dependent methyltransferase [Bacteroidales bacterium]